MCKVEGLDCPRDRWDAGYGYGLTGATLTQVWESIRRAGAFLTREERGDVFEGWCVGFDEWQAREYGPEPQPADLTDVPP